MAKDYGDGVWRTINGRKVFIAEGQSLGDAMKKSGKFGKVSKVKGARKNTFKDEISQGDKNRFAMGQGLSKEAVKGYAKARQDEKEKKESIKKETPIKKNFPSNMSKEIYEMDVDKGNAWSGNAPTKNANGDKVMFVSKNGKSENTAEDIVREMQSKHPELNARISDNGNEIMFTLKKGDESSKERTYEQVNKEWKDQASKMEKNYKEFGGNTIEDEKKLNDLSKERDSLQYKKSPREVKEADERYNSPQGYSKDEQDILDRYSEDYGYDKGDNLKNLKGQIDYMRNPGDSIHRTAERLVEGGDFLIYNEDVKDYLDERGIKYNEDNFFDKYKKDMADKIEKLYNSESPKKTTNDTMNKSLREKASKKQTWKPATTDEEIRNRYSEDMAYARGAVPHGSSDERLLRTFKRVDKIRAGHQQAGEEVWDWRNGQRVDDARNLPEDKESTSKIFNDAVRNRKVMKAYQNYIKKHPNSQLKLNEFKDLYQG